MTMLVGFGYDVHRLVPGRPLVLGGVRIPHALGLDGHSDADVILHALMDALLGAAGLGDIGQQFPPSDPAYKGADSLDLLRRVVALLEAEGYRPVNCDITLLAERPKIGPHVGQMRERISGVLGVAPRRVGIKATTNEGMGFVGREEGMAAYAVALIAEA
ncbi:2-C-methyl-D-erythritol 2,4-cyclodiphosphate synthase [Symbiobacterium terraclitae]|uniref:2-C-methyl-D-erythritol 2,4-cyclodiphosphate synthase n=2 Tax=Symbiobacterium terraclitae TaxID=557451 RepID=A0ABS4JS80_9FIRM|nr:2-C-methyl-D-erythritol 2,4-cyclodiphosphate synthase [Symbiobacterium terraclitae]